MNLNIICNLLWLFLVYSFLGWVLETAVAATKQKHMVNRGIINGPFCVIYGIGALCITVVAKDLTGFWLFVGSVILSTLIEWIAGHLIEKINHQRLWDYSSLPWNLDGYISFPTSLLWGFLGFIMMKWGNRLCLQVFQLLPRLLGVLLVLILTGIVLLDGAATLFILSGRSKGLDKWQAADRWLDSVSTGFGNKIYGWIDRRITKAYPHKKRSEVTAREKSIFAYGCSFYKIVMLFFIGAFLGDITETIFCRITAGVWMSRSSVVWGPFSIVWGLAISAATVLLYKYRNKSDSFLFCMGTFLGGAYEYICSVFTEIVFGTVFWDYSKMPFNLGGRINLLYCFFWGIAAIVWLKKLYPIFSRLIEKIPKKPGILLTWLLLLFMLCNILMSSAALSRYNTRSNGAAPANMLEEWLDEHYDDTHMEQIYPNALKI